MPEDALVNTGAVQWPSPDSAFWTVREMQIKLHRWAGEDPSRRFGDLFNLVYHPAFLMHAWERVAGNVGARTPGIDRATVLWIETRIGVEAFLNHIRDSLRSGEFEPVVVRQVMIPKASGKLRKLGIPPTPPARGWSTTPSVSGSWRKPRPSWRPRSPRRACCCPSDPLPPLSAAVEVAAYRIAPGGRRVIRRRLGSFVRRSRGAPLPGADSLWPEIDQ